MVSALPPGSLHFRQQRRQRRMRMVTSELVMQVTKDTFNEIGSGAVARQPEQDEVRVARQPVANIAGSMNALVVRHHVHTPKAHSGVGAIQGLQQTQEEKAVLLRPGLAGGR